MPSNWISDEYKRQTCRTSLLVSDPRYIPDYHLSASSWTPAGKPSSGRASKKISNAWCPEINDRESYLQVGCRRMVWPEKSMFFLSFTVQSRSLCGGCHWFLFACSEVIFVQVDLGYVQRVSEIGTMVKLKGRHAKRIEVHYSKNGINWDSDGKVLEFESFV